MDRDKSEQQIQDYARRQLPPGWKIEGQMEQCPETLRYHYQALLKTNQQRFKAIKDVMGNAHIEAAKSKTALTKYVSKQETRIAEIAANNGIPTIFEYQNIIAGRWDNAEFDRRYNAAIERRRPFDSSDIAMDYLDHLVSEDIERGIRGIEFIAINPMWRSSWKKFWRSIIARHASHQAQSSSQEDDAPSPSDAQAQDGVCDM